MLPSGAIYSPSYLAKDDQSALLALIEAQPWRNDLKRRVQHYGYLYDYRARRLNRDSYIGALPDWLARHAERLASEGYFGSIPDQVIINEYLPGQGIAAHIDCEPCFGGTVASLSLGSQCIMDFAHTGSKDMAGQILEPGSLLVLSGEARFTWTHSIAARRFDLIDGTRTARTRRVSLTFRTVLLE